MPGDGEELFLSGIGEVSVAVGHDGLSFQPLHPVIVTERAGHAYDTLSSITDKKLKTFDGVVAVGGDGLFNEILNGILSSRYTTSYPPTPEGFRYGDENSTVHTRNGVDYSMHTPDSANTMIPRNSNKSDDHEPLLSSSQHTGLDISSSVSFFKFKLDGTADQDHVISFPNDWFRVGIIPSGSTDAIVLSTTGVRDPVTSALLIILGRRMSLDIAQVVRWKSSPTAEVLPTVRYAASFAGYALPLGDGTRLFYLNNFTQFSLYILHSVLEQGFPLL
ncbi:hypothetical protein PR202_ga02189 [Eleusine coracana subsp. coracana]|uniref:DAGKc domain-containing protein n=1 Tax=Eleusine coracana subsp. coracana TaxID=191504 RepID=A0AAV5BJ24_ELECO|nr:hypothetical protein PR202_ga02189 [Eleusine coracana subsp. coracana]